MFFIGIFGIDTKDEEVKELPSVLCTKCHQTHAMTLYKHYQVLHFFFIPLLKWNITYYVACPNCQNISLLKKGKGEELEKEQGNDLTYWDLEPITSQEQPSLPHFKKCPQCDKWIDEDYAYCPHCGQTQESSSTKV